MEKGIAGGWGEAGGGERANTTATAPAEKIKKAMKYPYKRCRWGLGGSLGLGCRGRCGIR